MPILADIFFREITDDDPAALPVVLIHGAGGNQLNWPTEIRRLPGYRVLGVDLPGHGASAGRGQRSIDDYAQSIINWLDAMEIERTFIAGHSMGGAIALTLGIQHCDRIIGLGLVSCGARLPISPKLLEDTSNPLTCAQAKDNLNKELFSPNTSARLLEISRKHLDEVRQDVLHGDFIACDHFDVVDRLGDIHCPTLVVCGSEDQLTPLRYSQYLAATIPGAQLMVVPGAGHMVMLEKPQEVSTSISHLLEKIQ